MALPFYIQAYDARGVVVAHSECANELDAHRKFVELCVDDNQVVNVVEAYLTGDPQPLVYAFRGCKSMAGLMCDTSLRNVIN